MSGIKHAPWGGTIARVNMPDPDNSNMRIVGYRVPCSEAGLSQALFVLERRDFEVARLRSQNARLVERLRNAGLLGEAVDVEEQA